jgi:hypothetical protein
MAGKLYTLNLETFLLAGKDHNHVVCYHTCVQVSITVAALSKA